jgi:hypothetical protein
VTRGRLRWTSLNVCAPFYGIDRAITFLVCGLCEAGLGIRVAALRGLLRRSRAGRRFLGSFSRGPGLCRLGLISRFIFFAGII